MRTGEGDEIVNVWLDGLNATLHGGNGVALATKANSATHHRSEPLEGHISSSAAMHAFEVAAEDEDFICFQLCDELWSECWAFNTIEGSNHCMCSHGSVIVWFLPFAAFLDGALVTAAIELDAVPVQDPEDAGAALESAHAPDIVHRYA